MRGTDYLVRRREEKKGQQDKEKTKANSHRK
jgi:hypothetical protein